MKVPTGAVKTFLCALLASATLGGSAYFAACVDEGCCAIDVGLPKPDPCSFAGEKCTRQTENDALCVPGTRDAGALECLSLCETFGDACSEGGCYWDGAEPGHSVCAPPGIGLADETCIGPFDCVVGLQCIDLGGGSLCRMVCTVSAECDDGQDCVATAHGFNVCVPTPED
jgi:hypothetical protein